MIRLIVCYYPDKNKERDLENIAAINHNMNCNSIDEIILLLEYNCIFPGEISSNTRTRSLSERPSFNSIIEIGNSLAHEDDITVFCNTDIYFDESIKRVNCISEKEIYALSRYDLVNEQPQLFARYDSQDAWVYKGKIKDNTLGNFYFGVPACDNVLVTEFRIAGYKVCNPCFSIKCYHLHASNFRNYHTTKNYVSGEKSYLFPESLDSNLTKKEQLIIRDVCYDYYSFKIKNSKSFFSKIGFILKKLYYFKWERYFLKILLNKPINNYSAH